MTNKTFDYLSQRWNRPRPIDKVLNDVPHLPGHKLPNGAIILDEVTIRSYEHRRDSIVLAISSGHQPFISWHRVVTSDSPMGAGGFGIVDTCAWGEYSHALEPAISKFKARVESKRIALMKDEMKQG